VPPYGDPTPDATLLGSSVSNVTRSSHSPDVSRHLAVACPPVGAGPFKEVRMATAANPPSGSSGQARTGGWFGVCRKPIYLPCGGMPQFESSRSLHDPTRLRGRWRHGIKRDPLAFFRPGKDLRSIPMMSDLVTVSVKCPITADGDAAIDAGGKHVYCEWTLGANR